MHRLFSKGLAASGIAAALILSSSLPSTALVGAPETGPSALESVLDAQPFEDASQAVDENQRIALSGDGSMTIGSAAGDKVSVRAVTDGGAVKLTETGDLSATEIAVAPSTSFVFAAKEGISGAGFAVLKDATSERSFGFDIEVNGAPAQLSIGSTGSVVVMDSTGRVINHIESPWARDANGNDVATSYTAEGGRLIQSVSPSATSTYPIVADPQFGWNGPFPVVRFNKSETSVARVTGGVLAVCGKIAAGLPIGLAACSISAVQIAAQAAIANARGECVMLAPAPIGVMAFRYTGGYCQ